MTVFTHRDTTPPKGEFPSIVNGDENTLLGLNVND
jgi:hypothetical protein